MHNNPLSLLFFKTTLLALLACLVLPGCQKGDLSALDEETVISSLSLSALTVTVNNAIIPSGGTIAIMPMGEKQQIDVTGTTTSGGIVTPSILNDKVNWSVSNTAVAQINNTGLLTGIAAGTVTVTASLGSLPSASVDIEIAAANVIAITIDIDNDPTTAPPASASADVFICQQKQLYAAATYDTGSTTFDWDVTADVIWTSTDPDTRTNIDAATPGLVAYVPAALPATPPATVTPPISATLGSTSGSFNLNVIYNDSNDFTSVRIDPTSLSLPVNQTAQMAAFAVRNSVAVDDDITKIALWASANSTVATVSATGLVTGVKTSTNAVNMSAGCAGLSAVSPVTVTQSNLLQSVLIVKPASGIHEISKTSAGGLANSVSLKALAIYSDSGNGIDITADASTNWTASNLEDATLNTRVVVDNSTSKGLVTPGVDVGYALVKVTFGGQSDFVLVNVKP